MRRVHAVKVVVLTRGGLAGEVLPEVSRGHSSRGDVAEVKGRTVSVRWSSKAIENDEDPDNTGRWSQAGEEGEAFGDCRSEGESDSSAPEERKPGKRRRST